MGARLAATVYVADPETHQTVRLDAGSEPEPRHAALVTNPAAWEDGKLPAAAQKTAVKQEQSQAEPDPKPEGDDSSDDKPAAKKTAAARPARGRKSAADEGSGS